MILMSLLLFHLGPAERVDCNIVWTYPNSCKSCVYRLQRRVKYDGNEYQNKKKIIGMLLNASNHFTTCAQRISQTPIISLSKRFQFADSLLGNAQHQSQLGGGRGGRGGKEVFGSTFFIFSAFHLFILWNTNITYFCTALSQPRRSELPVLYLPSKSF